MTLEEWLVENPPTEMPFYPGARYTEPFGLRRHWIEGTSPGHLGVDRAGGAGLRAPFDGTMEWDLYESSPIGSLLRLTPDDIELQVQVFHTEADREVVDIASRMRKRHRLPVCPGALGLASGVHTHTEVLIPPSEELKLRMTLDTSPYVIDGHIELSEVIGHCKKYDINVSKFRSALRRQIDSWGIVELWPHYAVRKKVWRALWGGPVAFVDSRRLLLI
jgi:hypothetical protein